MKLYELTGAYLELAEMAEEGIFDQRTINDTLEGLDMELEDKADGYAKVIRSLEGDIDSIDSEIKRLTNKKNVLKNNIAAMKKNLEAAMIAADKKKFKTALFGFGIQKNAPSLDVISEADIPAEFWRQQEPVLDKKAALNYIKENGDQEWGRKKQTESLRIR